MKDELLARAIALDVKSLHDTLEHETKVVNGFAEQLCTKKSANSSQTQPAPTRHRVMIVDDNSANQKLLQSLLDTFGYQCLVAHDGDEALTQLETHNVDLILMDLQLGAEDGRLVAQTILNKFDEKKSAQAKPPTLLAVSAFGEDSFEQPLTTFGFKGFLQKPFSSRDLYQTVSQIIPPTPKVKS